MKSNRSIRLVKIIPLNEEEQENKLKTLNRLVLTAARRKAEQKKQRKRVMDNLLTLKNYHL